MSTTTTRSVIIANTELKCRSEHPSARQFPRYQGRLHGIVIMNVPFLCVPTRRLLTKFEDVQVGFVAVYCADCKVYTEYEVVAPENAVKR